MFRTVIFLFFLLFLACCQRPLGVTHWDAKSRAMVKKSLASKKKNSYGYPKHTYLSYLICFNESCINRAERDLVRKRYRFKGYKNKEVIPPKAPSPQQSEPVIAQNEQPKQDLSAFVVNKVYRLRQVYFQTGKANLSVEAEKELDALVSFLQSNPLLIISVSGHTDDVGEEKANLALSQQRAQAVTAYLSAKGIAKKRLLAKGYGSSSPVADNHTQTGREQNRRVEFILQLAE
jgi:outer membrane protein OmpA-like peptidoglycan-associated protein